MSRRSVSTRGVIVRFSSSGNEGERKRERGRKSNSNGNASFKCHSCHSSNGRMPDWVQDHFQRSRLIKCMPKRQPPDIYDSKVIKYCAFRCDVKEVRKYSKRMIRNEARKDVERKKPTKRRNFSIIFSPLLILFCAVCFFCLESIRYFIVNSRQLFEMRLE